MRLAATCACLLLMPLAFMQTLNNCTINITKAPCNTFMNFTYEMENVNVSRKRVLVFKHHFNQLSDTEKVCLLKKVIEFYTLVNQDVWSTKIPENRVCEMYTNLVYFEDHCLKCEICQEMFGNKTQAKKKDCTGIFDNTRAKPKRKCFKEIVEGEKEPKKKNCKKVSGSKAQSNRAKCTKSSINKKHSRVKVCTGILGKKSNSECRKYNKDMNLNGTEILNCQLRSLKTQKKKKPAKVQEKFFDELKILWGFLRSAK
ncbi:uncharacterized protein [Hyperolius riggenbachi]|uniref:uncharacterized protein n=1 Tax=Hyperolius riggenbachi TaxID=752182 RepID=UPI0035A39EDB